MSYTLEVTLRDYKPKNWRKVIAWWDMTFAQLCNGIISLYWLEPDHLWEYRYEDSLFINSPEFGDVDIDMWEFEEDKEFDDLQWLSTNHNGGKYKLSDYFSNHKNITLYYDFGDNRVFDIKLLDSTDDWPGWEVVDGDWYYLISGIGGVEWLDELLQEYKKKAINPDLFESWEDFEEYMEPALKKFSILK